MSEAETKTQSQKPKTSRLSIISLSLALAAFLVLFSLPKFLEMRICVFYRLIERYTTLILLISALVIAFMALFRIKRRKIRGISITVIAIVLSLFILEHTLLLPRKRSYAFAMVCGSKLSNLGRTILIYASNHEGKFPTAFNWCDLLLENTDITEEDLMCGKSFLPDVSYGFNKNLNGLSFDQVDPNTVLLFEIEGGRNVTGGPEIMDIDKHDKKGSNVLFVNGHVEFVRPEEVGELKWKTEENKSNSIK